MSQVFNKASRKCTMTGVSVQTEASFVPDCVGLKYTYEPLASEQFSNLVQLRKLIQECMKNIAGDVYDVQTFKDILMEMEEELPSTMPLTDLLLLSSRLFRRTAELGRMLGCFFGVVFADDHADDHFHFAEVRILQRELRDLRRKYAESEDERERLEKMLSDLGQVAFDHGKAVELLESHNSALKKQTSALEDQMAVLFHELNTDLETNCKDAYDRVNADVDMQEKLNPARVTFRQTMDSLSDQLRGSRQLIIEVRDTLSSCSQGSRSNESYQSVEPAVRFKLKMLDSNFQQLMGRFSAVKDTVAETGQELMTALQERKKILYLSFQHIRLYDLQNAKLRRARATLALLKQGNSEFVQRLQATFPGGTLTSVDRLGRITIQRWQGGYTLAALRGHKMADKMMEDGDGPRRISPRGPPLPGLTEAQIMAAESELAALEGKDYLPLTHSSAMSPVSMMEPSVYQVKSQLERKVSVAASAARARRQNSTSQGVMGSPSDTKLTPTASPTDTGGPLPSSSDAAAFETVQEFITLMHQIDGRMDEIGDALHIDDEVSAFLRTITLSVASTPRPDGGSGFPGGTAGGSMQTGSLENQEYMMEKALAPTGADGNATPSRPGDGSPDVGKPVRGEPTSPSFSRSVASPPLPGAPTSPTESTQSPKKVNDIHSDAALARQALQLQRQQEQITKMQEDFTSKLGFLRQVYEARISDLEVKESNLSKKFGLGRNLTSAGTDRISSAGGSVHQKNQNKAPRKTKELDVVVSQGHKDSPQSNTLQQSSDRDQLLRARGQWQKAKKTLHGNRVVRDLTNEEVDKLVKNQSEEPDEDGLR